MPAAYYEIPAHTMRKGLTPKGLDFYLQVIGGKVVQSFQAHEIAWLKLLINNDLADIKKAFMKLFKEFFGGYFIESRYGEDSPFECVLLKDNMCEKCGSELKELALFTSYIKICPKCES